MIYNISGSSSIVRSEKLAKSVKTLQEATKCILCYLIHTRNHGILYKSHATGIAGYAHNLTGFTDVDFVGDMNNQKSMTGWVYTYNGALISWSSKKQSIMMRSTMEAELIAGSFTSVEGLWLLKLGGDFHLIFKLIPLFADNKAFILFSKNNVNNN